MHGHVGVHTERCHKISMSWILNLSGKATTIKCLGENRGEYFMTWDYAEVSLTDSRNNYKTVINLTFKMYSVSLRKKNN